MKIKVPLNFLDGVALEREIHNHCLTEVQRMFPIEEDSDPEEVHTDREAAYDTMYEHMLALVDLFKGRSYAIFNFNFETKQARLVGVK